MLGGSDSNPAAKARFREAVPAQRVDATLSNQLIRQYFSRAPISKAVLNQNLNRAVFSFNQRSRMNLAFETPADTSSAECCVDPLRQPDLPGSGQRADLRGVEGSFRNPAGCWEGVSLEAPPGARFDFVLDRH